MILDDICLEVFPGEIVGIIGHNGAGKSTLLKAIFGMLSIWSGTINIEGMNSGSPSPSDLLRNGVTYAMQGNRVFAELTVRENLEIGMITARNRVSLGRGLDRVRTLFPDLYKQMGQKAGTLSSGEKQALALASALVLYPKLLLLDEPSLGLAPPLVKEVFRRIREISNEIGMAVMIVEQKVTEVMRVSDRVCALKLGRLAFSGTPSELSAGETLKKVFLI
jgi:ABC-type branched-subunit amino acid transport system ATPase component